MCDLRQVYFRVAKLQAVSIAMEVKLFASLVTAVIVVIG